MVKKTCRASQSREFDAPSTPVAMAQQQLALHQRAGFSWDRCHTEVPR